MGQHKVYPVLTPSGYSYLGFCGIEKGDGWVLFMWCLHEFYLLEQGQKKQEGEKGLAPWCETLSLL